MRKITVPIGESYGMLTVVADGSSGKWLCKCACGVSKEMYSGGIRKGSVVSCGCAKSSRASSLFKTHGRSNTDSYATWKSMHQRVKRDSGYVGVEVCARWTLFENFFDDMGERPEGLTLDRVNGALGYSPENCRWATVKEQAVNRRTTVMLDYEGKSMCVADWAREIGVSRKGVMKRLNKGWPIHLVLAPIVKGAAK